MVMKIVKELVLIIIILLRLVVMTKTEFSAMFVFGDSLIDPGNNNYLSSLAKANYFPYGVDFYQGPSGRFCNGRTIIDYLGDLLGIPLLPAYSNPFATGKNILKGVNFASAAGGILDQSGLQLGERYSANHQLENFNKTLNELKNQMPEGELKEYIRKCLGVMILGSNDYLNNYLLPSLYTTSQNYNPSQYAHLLIRYYKTQILALHNLGLKKFLLAGVGPLGCIPNQIAARGAPEGKCVERVNEIVTFFNDGLRSLVDDLNNNYRDSVFIYGNTYGAFTDILNNANDYGFSVKDRGCCGIGRKQGDITCLPFQMPCLNRSEHVFWDAFHPTEAVNQIIAKKAYSGPTSDCYPMNLKQMELLP